MAKLKLHQIIALVGGRKRQMTEMLTNVYRGWHPDRLMGLTKTYDPNDEEGDRLPTEERLVQVRMNDVLKQVGTEIADFIDLLAWQEVGNTIAAADVKVERSAHIEPPVNLLNVPVNALLFLERHLTDMRTVIESIPTLSQDREWKYDENRGCYATKPIKTHRTSKVPTPLVKYHATTEHPAQVDVVNVDKIVGYYTTVTTSGAVPVEVKEAILFRLQLLSDAVKLAREQANSVEVEMPMYGKAIAEFLFAPVLK